MVPMMHMCMSLIVYTVNVCVPGIHSNENSSLSLYSYNIMERCWKQDPENRPTFSEVHQTLSTFIEEQNSYNYISMAGIDLCPIECAQGEDEGSD